MWFFFPLHISQTFLPLLENVLSTDVYPFKMSLQEIHALLFSETVYARIARDIQYIILEPIHNISLYLRWIWPTRVGAGPDVPSKLICFWCLKMQTKYLCSLALLIQKKLKSSHQKASTISLCFFLSNINC